MVQVPWIKKRRILARKRFKEKQKLFINQRDTEGTALKTMSLRGDFIAEAIYLNNPQITQIDKNKTASFRKTLFVYPESRAGHTAVRLDPRFHGDDIRTDSHGVS